MRPSEWTEFSTAGQHRVTMPPTTAPSGEGGGSTVLNSMGIDLISAASFRGAEALRLRRRRTISTAERRLIVPMRRSKLAETTVPMSAPTSLVASRCCAVGEGITWCIELYGKKW